MKKDKLRDAYFEALGLKVIRVTNLDVFENIEGVVEYISKVVEERIGE